MSDQFTRTYRSKNLLDKFFIYAKQYKIELLDDDKKWLNKICLDVPQDNLRRLLNKYLQIWVNVMREEKIEHVQQNKGRYAANTWIRRELTGK